jgi:cytochrome c553
MMRRLLLLVVLLAAGGGLILVSGVVPIEASSGHWRITDWLLHFAMRRSVATHSLGIDAPALDDPALVLVGATHYEMACSPCHGRPGLEHPRVARGMTPAPPYLGPRIADWTPEQLFYVVKHGVKFTGMPAWPALHRDDEVWAVVAFLLQLPRLDADAYRDVALGHETERSAAATASSMSEAARSTLLDSCFRCHGADGLGRGAAFPKLAGQRASYLQNSLEAYARGARHSGIMEPIAIGLDPEVMRELSEHYGSLPRAPSVARSTDDAAIARGEEIARRGIRAQRVPACVHCHGPNPRRMNPAYPLHAGQHAGYLARQLELFKRGQRGGSPYARVMQPIAGRLRSEQIRDVALYYESLGPRKP